MSTLYVLSGLPGCGKSTWAKRFLASHPNTVIVSSDAIREELLGGRQNFSQENLVWKTFENRIHEYGKQGDINVIADSTALLDKYRENYAHLADTYDKKVLVYFDIPFEICCFQNKLRTEEKIVPQNAMSHLLRNSEPISDKTRALYDEVIISTEITEEAKKQFTK